MSGRVTSIVAAAAMAVTACASPASQPTGSTDSGASTSTSSRPSPAHGCTSTTASSSNGPVVRLGISSSLAAAAQLLALDRGYFAQVGVSAERAPEINSGNVQLIMASLLSGQVDAIGVAVDAGLFNAVGRGAGVKIVGAQAEHEPGASGTALVVRKELVEGGRVKTYADLNGLRIGIAGHGNASEFQVHKALEAGGLSLSDVQLTTMDFPTMSSALTNGALDAGIFPEPFLTQLVNSGIGVAWRRTGDVVPGMQTTVLVFSPRLLADHELAVRTMTAYLCGARDFNDAFVKNVNRQAVVQELINDTTMKDPKLYDQMSYAIVDPNGQVNVDNIEDQLHWYTEMGYVTEQIDLSSLYDPTIAGAAVAQLGEYH